MAKKFPKKKSFSLQGFDSQATQQTEAYVQAVGQLYNKAIQEFAILAVQANFDATKPFSFADYPQAKAKANEIIAGLTSKMKSAVNSGSYKQWLFACQKNDAFLSHIMNTANIPKRTLAKFQDRNLDALSTFQNRKTNGLDLSQRIWNYTGQMQDQMELGIDIALGDGRSAAELSRDLRQYLLEPDKLFRRIRDKYGNLKLSKAAKAYHPGQGIYRSSYKNAMRLTRTEINMAYRESDQLRWEKLDFVIGYEIKLSNNHTINGVPFTDICDTLAGKYPKSFKFKGWHPQCRCFKVPILMDRKELETDELNELKAAINGTEYQKYESPNTITDVPEGFKNWIKENKERAKGWKSQPYFIKDNFVGGKIEGGLKLPNKISKIPAELSKDSDYLQSKNIEFSEVFFGLINENINLKVFAEGSGSFYNVGSNTVNIVDDARAKASDWQRERVVYHEYGHAIDWQRGLHETQEIKNLMKSIKKDLNKKYKGTELSGFAQVSERIDKLWQKVRSMKSETFTKLGITKNDINEQLGALADTIMSLNINYGYGHSKKYFKMTGAKEAEFIAHCFENKFVGNIIFKKFLPDVYQQMISFIDSLK